MRNSLIILFLMQIFSLLYAKDYHRNVIREGRDVYIKIPAVNQIKKGCNISSATMILKYFGREITPEAMKKGKPRTISYKNTLFVNRQIMQKGFKIKKLPDDTFNVFSSSIKLAVDNGIPIWWECNLAFAPPTDYCPKTGTTLHRRLINGYTFYNNQISDIFYSDSWGEKHINKRMSLSAAYNMTKRKNQAWGGIQIIYPSNYDPVFVKEIADSTPQSVSPLEKRSDTIEIKADIERTPLNNKRPLPTWRKRQLETDRMADEILAKEVEKKGK